MKGIATAPAWPRIKLIDNVTSHFYML